jgi:WD40 repeat protein
MDDNSRRFRAFISYSQRDKSFAKRLQRWLESYQVPVGALGDLEPGPIPKKLGRFFRDEEEMAATSDIAGMVRGAIEDSQSLIVVCSPNSAKSSWVNAEIEHFRRTGRGGQVFAVILDGEPNSGDPETECFPPGLRQSRDTSDQLAMPIEPLAMDIRKDSRARLLTRIAAGLLGIEFDKLWRRERRRAVFRRVRQLTYSVAIAAVFAGVVSFAIRAVSIERSRQLALASLAESSSGQYDRALRLAILAARDHGILGPPSVEAEPALARAAANTQTLVEFSDHTAYLQTAAFSADGRFAATSGEDETTRVWDSHTGELISVFRGHVDDPETELRGGVNEGVAQMIMFSPDGQLVLTAGLESDETGTVGRVWQSANGEEVYKVSLCDWTATFTEDVIASTEFYSNCDRVYSAVDGRLLEGISAASVPSPEYPFPSIEYQQTEHGYGIELLEQDASNPTVLFGHTSSVAVAVSGQPGTPFVATGSFDKTARIWDSRDGVEQITLVGHEKVVTDLAFSPYGERVLSVSADGTARIWGRPADAVGENVSGPTSDNPRNAFGEWVIEGDVGMFSDETLSPDVYLRNSKTGQTIAHLNGPGGHKGHINSVRFSNDGKRVITAGDDSTFRIWDPRSGAQLARYVEHEERVLDANISPDGERLATVAWDGVNQIQYGPRLWDARTGLELIDLTPPDPRPFNNMFEVVFSEDGLSLFWSGDDFGGNSSITEAAGPTDRRRAGLPDLITKACQVSDGFLGGTLRKIRDSDVVRVPALEGRQGEDVCAGGNTWMQLLSGHR